MKFIPQAYNFDCFYWLNIWPTKIHFIDVKID